jgi:uncharacterized protein YjcR
LAETLFQTKKQLKAEMSEFKVEFTGLAKALQDIAVNMSEMRASQEQMRSSIDTQLAEMRAEINALKANAPAPKPAVDEAFSGYEFATGGPLSDSMIEAINDMYQGGYSVEQIASEFGLSKKQLRSLDFSSQKRSLHTTGPSL